MARDKQRTMSNNLMLISSEYVAIAVSMGTVGDASHAVVCGKSGPACKRRFPRKSGMGVVIADTQCNEWTRGKFLLFLQVCAFR